MNPINKARPPLEVWPVIHLINIDDANRKADIAFRSGCLGVFVISMIGHDEAVVPAALILKKRYPEKLIGINLLRSPPDEALKTSVQNKLDATWTDAPGIHSEHISESAKRVHTLLSEHKDHLFFGSVAFKYQRPEPSPSKAAQIALSMQMIPTTSGTATGQAAPINKLKAIREAIGPLSPLALASGVTPSNAKSFAPYVSHILVATGISDPRDNFEEEKLRILMHAVLNL